MTTHTINHPALFDAITTEDEDAAVALRAFLKLAEDAGLEVADARIWKEGGTTGVDVALDLDGADLGVMPYMGCRFCRGWNGVSGMVIGGSGRNGKLLREHLMRHFQLPLDGDLGPADVFSV